VVGLEGYFNDVLSGEDGKQLVQKVSHGIWIPLNDLMEVEPKRGMDIKSTLDMEIQDVTQNALLKALEHHDAEFGVAIVMEVETGAIKAIANLQEVEGGYAEIYNHAIGTLVEPGSTMKLASIMALLEDGFVSLEDSVSLSYGLARFCKTTELHDSEPHGFDRVSIQKAFEKSSNVGMARLTSRSYTDTEREQQFINRLKQFHLDKPTGVEIIGEAKPYVKNKGDERWSCLSVPWMSIGYEIQLTPLQMLNLYNTVANDGRMMKPYLVSEVRSKNRLVKSFKPSVLDNSIARTETIEKAKALLEGVVENGTAKKIQSKYLRFAGKTGTARIDYDGNGKKKYQASFAGYFPADDPKYSCIVLVRNPRRNGYYGGTVAGPVFREIAEKTIGIEYLQTEGQVASERLKVESQERYPAYQVVYRQESRSILKHTGAKFRESGDEDYVVLLPEGDSLLLKERKVERDLVPNVVGMSLKDALYVLENRGLNTTVNGYGRVAAQSVPPGSALDEQKIELTLK
jgi:cell division protein FtsI (penicillin-binding protein 3)